MSAAIRFERNKLSELNDYLYINKNKQIKRQRNKKYEKNT